MGNSKPVSRPATGSELIAKPEESEYLEDKETQGYQALIGPLICLIANI